MYIQSRSMAAIYRLVIGVLATVGAILQFVVVGGAAWRIFPTWMLVIAAVYFLVSAIFTVFYTRREPGQVICPMLQGVLVIAGTIITTATAIFSVSGMPAAGPTGFILVLSNFCIPILILLDWVIFTKKGAWRFSEPFYWLALPVIYVCWILTTAAFMPATGELIYPYGFLDFPVIGIDIMLWWIAIMVVLILAFGYIYVTLDFAMSGKLGEHIVLPKIKTIIVEENVEPEVKPLEAKPKVAPAKTSDTTKATKKGTQISDVKVVKQPNPRKAKSKAGQQRANSSKTGQQKSKAPKKPTNKTTKSVS